MFIEFWATWIDFVVSDLAKTFSSGSSQWTVEKKYTSKYYKK